MPLTTAADVLDSAKSKAGILARRVGDPLLAPTDDDDDTLTDLLEDALTELAMKTRRLEDEATVSTDANTATYSAPPHVHVIQRATFETPAVGAGDPTITALEIQSSDRTRMNIDAAQPGEHSRPEYLAHRGGEFLLFPVPDEAGTLRVYFWQNGDYREATPGVPTLDELVAQVPKELRRSVRDYMLAVWFDDIGQEKLANNLYGRWNSDTKEYSTKSNITRRTTRTYRPHGL